jgi:hypothetical protein
MTSQLKQVLLASVAGLAGALLALLAIVGAPSDAAVAVLIAAGLLLGVRVPWGGRVPMSGAAVTAVVALMPHWNAVGTLAVALTVGAVVVVCRRGRPEAVEDIARFTASTGLGLGAGVVISLLVDGTVPVLGAAVAAAAGVMVGDLAVGTLRQQIELRSALPVHLTLACAGILIAVAVDGVGVAMAAVAAFPLLITRFSFDRYAGATDTLDQTVQALGLVPELAGLAPLGHSERSAHYAVALSRELGFDRATTTRVVTATRLHHLGSVPMEDDDPINDVAPGAVAEQGARILREAGLPNEVADLLAAANADALDAMAPTLEAAVVRIAATFDDLVGDDVDAADRGLALVSGAARDPHSRRAAAALLELAATDGGLVRDAVAAGDRFRDAAVGLDLEAVTSIRSVGEILPFTRRG